MRIAIGADHGGYDLKESIKRMLAGRGVEVEDVGCVSREAVDYPDLAAEVCTRVSEGTADEGVLVCTTGTGMSIAANKYPLVRAALCCTAGMAEMAREHNNANVLVLGGKLLSEAEAHAIADAWFAHRFSAVDRHARRLDKISNGVNRAPIALHALLSADPEIYAAVRDEMQRQQQTLNLIASENTVSPAVRQAQGSVMTNKYAEGYPGKRWYNGCQCVDVAEQLAIDRACALFGADRANVQPHCGSSANMAVYFAALEPGDTVLAMNLAHGGHLTHGNPVNFSGRFFNFVGYGVREGDELIDYDALAAQAAKVNPKLIVVGASAYPRILDFARFRAIADAVGASLMVDMAHIAGLVAGGAHPSPVPYAEYVTTTTHKTLRGPRGGMVLCREAFAKEIDKQVFPGTQGGPLMHTIAAKAVCLREAMQPSFRRYAAQIVANAKGMAERFLAEGLRLVSGGTDNHLMLVDVTSLGLTGKDAAAALDRAGIIVNKNAIPFDTHSPFVTSGIRIGTPLVTARGMGVEQMRVIADLIVGVLRHPADEAWIARTRSQVRDLTAAYPAE